MNELKPGVKSSEAWVTFLVALAGLALAFEAIGPSDYDTLVEAIPDIVKGLTAAIIVVTPVWKYISGRVQLKAKQLEAHQAVAVIEKMARPSTGQSQSR